VLSHGGAAEARAGGGGRAGERLCRCRLCELSLGRKLHDSRLGSHGIHRGAGDILFPLPCQRLEGAGAGATALEQEPKLLPVFPTGDLGHRGVRGAVGLGCRFTYKRTLPPAPSSGWFCFIANSWGSLKFKAKVLPV
jgi:hypothetical protein